MYLRIEEYWNPQCSDVIDYGRDNDIPSKVPKVIDYRHGDCIEAVNDDSASSSGPPSTYILPASSKSSEKYALNSY